jgi:hypothetical protein
LGRGGPGRWPGKGERELAVQRDPSKENFILFFVLLGAAVLLVVAAAILIGYFFAQPRPHFGEPRVEEIGVVNREAGQPAAPGCYRRAFWPSSSLPTCGPSSIDDERSGGSTSAGSDKPWASQPVLCQAVSW